MKDYIQRALQLLCRRDPLDPPRAVLCLTIRVHKYRLICISLSHYKCQYCLSLSKDVWAEVVSHTTLFSLDEIFIRCFRFRLSLVSIPEIICKLTPAVNYC